MDTSPSTPPAPATPPPKSEKPGRGYTFNPWRIFIGLFIVLIGLAMLAQQFGWTWIHVEDVWKLWPIMIILIGLSMLSKGHVINMIVSLVLGLIIIAAGVMVIVTGSTHRATSTKTISVPIATAVTSGTIRLDAGASKVTLTGGADKLVDGTFTSNVTELTTDSTVSTGVQHVALKMDQPTSWWWGGMKNQLDARLTSTLPVELDIHSGASDLTLDLANVKAQKVTIDSGAASVDLHLGELVDANAVDISAGASSITVTVPKAVGAAVVLDAAVSSKTLPGFTETSTNHYQSEGYATATKKINLSIHAGASSITVTRI